VRKTIASSLGTAFGFVTGLVWSQVVLGGFAVANITLTAGTDSSSHRVAVTSPVKQASRKIGRLHFEN